MRFINNITIKNDVDNSYFIFMPESSRFCAKMDNFHFKCVKNDFYPNCIYVFLLETATDLKFAEV